MLIVSVREAPGRRIHPARVGQLIVTVWARLRVELPNAAGHRVSWGELWFITSTSIDRLCPIACSVSSVTPRDPEAEIWVAVAPCRTSPTARLLELDELATALGKIRYRNAYPHALCILNGSVVHRPD